jgi:hypothetical protein
MSTAPHNDDLEKAMETADPYRGQGTTYLHVPDDRGQDVKRTENPTGAVVVPISLATTFRQDIPGQATAPDDPNSFGMGYEYSRTGNPTRGAFERATAAAEHARYCVAFASGSAATSAIVHLLQQGDHILCVDDVYGGTQRYFRRIVQPANGIRVDFCDMSGADVPFQETTKLLWLETPTNPTLKITDIGHVSTLTNARNCLLAVDNTFCSPYFQTPLDHGADLVVHSVTKYIGANFKKSSTMKFLFVCLAIFIAATNALPNKQEPESCQDCREKTMHLFDDWSSDVFIDREKDFLIANVCPELDRGCEVGVNNWWDEMAMVVFSSNVAARVCSNINPECNAALIKAWDCDTCMAHVMDVGRILSSDQTVLMATEAFQGKYLCMDESLGLDADQIEVCQGYVQDFVPLAFPALFDDLEDMETASFVCEEEWDLACPHGKKSGLKKFWL